MKNIEHEACKALVSKFCANPKSWAQELKIARKLLNLSPDLKSWYALELPMKINSLAYFLTEDGKIFVPKSQKNDYLLDLEKFKG